MRPVMNIYLGIFLYFCVVAPVVALDPAMEEHLGIGLSGKLPMGGIGYDATLQGQQGTYTLSVLNTPCNTRNVSGAEDPNSLELVQADQRPTMVCYFDRVQVTPLSGDVYAVRVFQTPESREGFYGEFRVSPVAPARPADTLPQRPDPGKPVTRATAELLQQFLPAGSQHVPLGKTDLGICSDGTRYMDGSPNGGHCVSVAENSDLARAGLQTHDRLFYVLLDVGSQVLIGDDTQSIFLMLGRGHIGRAYEIHYEKPGSTNVQIARFEATDWYFERHGDQFGNRPSAGLPSISRNCRAERVVVQLSGLDEFDRYVPADACRKIIFVPEGWSFALPNHGLTAEYRGYTVQRYRR